MAISQTIREFITLAIHSGGWMEMDRIYLQNRLLALVREIELDEVTQPTSEKSSLELLDELLAKAISNQKIHDISAEKEILEAKIMDLMTPPPSVINALFSEKYAKNKQAATDYFYQVSQENDYIKTRSIEKNIVFPTETEYGDLEITINLSKPEKDPKQIALEKSAPTSGYPNCVLCMTNEGYEGRMNYPARTNHRIIRMNLDGESWGFQYSPYAYYNEHSIFLAEEHRPMKITQTTFKRLLQIVDVFPHYFVGSNADLPIVGGSILSHDHYQGGRHQFPMASAKIEQFFELAAFPNVQAGTVYWPMSVIRLQSHSQQDLVNASTYILAQWTDYSDEALSIRAHSEDGTPHHTITPIARMNEGIYEIDLVLRDNNVSEEHPDGIFHPHQDIHHIKKENIGLIEVMGLAVLPPRLKDELVEVEKYLLKQDNQIAAYHVKWAQKIQEQPFINQENVTEIVQKEVGKIFARVLEDAGVYKRDEAGQAGFQRFIGTL